MLSFSSLGKAKEKKEEEEMQADESGSNRMSSCPASSTLSSIFWGSCSKNVFLRHRQH